MLFVDEISRRTAQVMCARSRLLWSTDLKSKGISGKPSQDIHVIQLDAKTECTF